MPAGQHYAIRTRTEWANDANAVGVKTLDQDGTGPNLRMLHVTQPETRWEEEDQTDPAGRYRVIVNGDIWTLQRAATAAWATVTTLFQVSSTGPILPLATRVNDDILFTFGNDNDIALVNRSTALGANTALTGVLVGTPVTPIGPAANSLIIGNVTANGDILLAVNNGGNSYTALHADASTGDTLLGAISGSSVDVYVAGTKVLDTAANLMTYEAAASTANQVLVVSNTSNAAAASHAYLEVKVGGTTSTGDPHVRFTIPSGTSWYMGPDNSNSDHLFVGQGTAVGAAPTVSGRLLVRRFATDATNAIGLQLDMPAFTTLTSIASTIFTAFSLASATITLDTATQITTLQNYLEVLGPTYAQSGGAVTVDKITAVAATPGAAGASVTITHSSAYRAVVGGAAVNVSNFFGENQTAGTTRNVQFMLATGQAAPAVLTDFVQVFVNDIAGGDARLGIVSESGSAIYLGNDRLRFAAATGLISIGATDVVSTTATVTTLTKNLVFSGLAAAGAGTALVIDGSNNITPLASSERFKANIRDLSRTEAIWEVRGRAFQWRATGEDDLGWVAEEVYAVYPELVNLKDGHPYSVKYSQAVVPMLVEMQKLRERVKELERMVGVTGA